MAKKRKAMCSQMPVVIQPDTSLTEQQQIPRWVYFKPQITDKDIFDLHKKTMKRNARNDRWMLEE